MTTTKFTDTTATQQGTVVFASWLNDVDSASYSTLSAVAGTANAITAVGPLSLSAFNSSSRFVFNPQTTNTGGVTINISALGNKAILKYGTTPLVAGDLIAGTLAEIFYDGASFQLQNPMGSVPPGAVVPISQGGTGATTKAAAQTALTGPFCSYSHTVAQTGVASNAATVALYNAVDVDATSMYTPATGIFKPTIAGYYLLTAALEINSPGGSFTITSIDLYKNGALYHRMSQGGFLAAAGLSFWSGGGACALQFNGTTDQATIVFQGGTTAGTVSTVPAGLSRFTATFLHP